MATPKNYYDILSVPRTSTSEEIKKAYRKLSLKWHPERAAGPVAEVEAKFADIAEAYEVLVNPARRAIFDQYGERGLKDGIPDGQGGMKGGKYAFGDNAKDIFAAFFGTSSPFADILGNIGDEPPAFYGELTGMQLPHKKTKPAPILVSHGVTLRELSNSATTKVTYTRKKLVDDTCTADEIVHQYVGLKPDMQEGLIATFAGAGTEGVDILPGDVEVEMFILPDPVWAVEGSTLVYTACITLSEALCGTILEIDTLDGRTISVPVTQIVSPGSTKVWPSEGMPDASGKKGDLLIKFEIGFPETLTPAQKAVIKAELNK